MIRIYKDKNDIQDNMELVKLNDIFFNENTCDLLDERAKDIIKKIDKSELVGKYKIKSRFGEEILNIDKLSSGCKTVLNVLYNPNKVFWILDCGENALEILYGLEKGNVYCETPMISFEMSSVEAYTTLDCQIIDDYEDLKEWWHYEK